MSLCNIDDAKLIGCILTNAYMEGASFCDSILDHANLENADLYMCFLLNTSLRHTNLSNALMLGTNLQDANLYGANLTKANLGLSNIGSRTKLQGANLSETIILDTDFTGAEFDNKTIFPKNFNPMTSGMILIGQP